MSFFTFFAVFLVAFFRVSKGILVEPGVDFVQLPTFQSLLQYEYIEFLKRTKNDSIHLQLPFKISGLTSSDVKNTWTLNDEELTVGENGKRATLYATHKYDSAAKQMSVVLHLKDNSAVPGKYLLTADHAGSKATGNITVQSPPILPIYSKPKRVLQGDPLRLSCKVMAEPLPSEISWSFVHIEMAQSDDKTTISNAVAKLKPLNLSVEGWDDVKLTNEEGTHQDTLRFAKLSTVQNGLYACNVSNNLGDDATFLLVDVKDRWAALWPFIGIVIEVTVLVAAILLYERHQMRAKASSATNNSAAPADVTTASPNGPAAVSVADKAANSEEVRLRNTPKA